MLRAVLRARAPPAAPAASPLRLPLLNHARTFGAPPGSMIRGIAPGANRHVAGGGPHAGRWGTGLLRTGVGVCGGLAARSGRRASGGQFVHAKRGRRSSFFGGWG